MQTGLDRAAAAASAAEAALYVPTVASQAEAEAGTDNSKLMTPLRVEEHMLANNLGWGQSWQNVTASRVRGTSYQNTTGRPIMVCAYTDGGTTASYFEVSSDDSTWIEVGRAGNTVGSFNIIVPAGWYYRAFGSDSLLNWAELR